jgi:hypothetical protein
MADAQIEIVVAESFADCPLTRRTLLFFGAARDVPDAANMVTGRDTLPDKCETPAVTVLSNRAATPEDVGHQRNHRYD